MIYLKKISVAIILRLIRQERQEKTSFEFTEVIQAKHNVGFDEADKRGGTENWIL